MFKVALSNSGSFGDEDRIYINGNKDLVKQLKDTILSHAWVSDYQEYEYLDDNNTCINASFNIGLYELNELVNECSIARLFYSFITDNQIDLDKRTDYLLQYWMYEVNMINEQKSYRSRLPKTSQDLTSASKLNKLLDRCEKEEFSPSPEQLFNFLENSDAMKGNTAYCQPLLPFEYEIEKFVALRKENFEKLRLSARILAQCHRDSTSIFSTLPPEVLTIVAAFTGNPLIHDENASRKIAANNFGKPPEKQTDKTAQEVTTILPQKFCTLF